MTESGRGRDSLGGPVLSLAGQPARAAVSELPDVQVVLGVQHRLRQRLQRFDLEAADRRPACSPAPCTAAETTGNS